MTEQTRPQLSDALLERMLIERAGPGAPADLVPAIATAVESTGQRASGPLGAVLAPGTSRPRSAPGTFTSNRAIRVAALAVAVVVAAAGAGLFLRLAPAMIGGPSSAPAIAPVPSASVAPSSSTPSPSPVATPRPAAVIAYIKYNVPDRTKPMVSRSRVWIVRADGTGAHELFPGGTGNQSGVAWSPNGSRLVDSEAGRLYLTDASGSAPQAVDPGCVPPACWDDSAAFSPDGTQLVLVRIHDVAAMSWPIATMDLASGRVAELSSTAALHPERPRWSADGKQIVFSSLDKSGNGSAVFVVDADGRNLRQLSSATLPARLPDWSPDGSRIVFTSLVINVVRVGGDNVADIYQDVYTVRPDWTDLRRLTTEGFSGGATWTPDGRIMFTRECTVQRPTGGASSADCSASGLWTMDADGSNARLVVPGGNGINGPLVGMFDAAWQPTP